MKIYKIILDTGNGFYVLATSMCEALQKIEKELPRRQITAFKIESISLFDIDPIV